MQRTNESVGILQRLGRDHSLKRRRAEISARTGAHAPYAIEWDVRKLFASYVASQAQSLLLLTTGGPRAPEFLTAGVATRICGVDAERVAGVAVRRPHAAARGPPVTRVVTVAMTYTNIVSLINSEVYYE
jgi:hypothetical protein